MKQSRFSLRFILLSALLIASFSRASAFFDWPYWPYWWGDRIIDGLVYTAGADGSVVSVSPTIHDCVVHAVKSSPPTLAGDIYILSSVTISHWNRPGDPLGMFSADTCWYPLLVPVLTIDNGAFAGCSEITSITIPSSITKIGSAAFSGCTGLTSITIPSFVTSIGSGAFSGCTGLTSITIPITVTEIEIGTFEGCNGLTSFTIPSSVTSIGSNAFSRCTGLTSIAIPSSVTSIGDGAFSGCTGLTSITIPSSVTSIGNNAFSGCTGLTSITIPSSVTSIGNNAFSGCTSLTSITIPSSVTSIGYNAFSDCPNLTSITIPSSVTSIGINAFSGCTGLTSITIPSSVTSIGKNAFSGCTALNTVYYNAVNCNDFNNQNGYNPFYNTNISTIIIGEDVERIPKYFAQNCSGLTSLTIPKSVTEIGDYAFLNCTGIKELTWNAKNCTKTGFLNGQVGYYLSKNTNTNIEKVTIGNEVEVLPWNFVQMTKITEVSIPNSVKNTYPFAFTDCKQLSKVTFGDSIHTIASCMFNGCTALTEVTIPNSVKYIINDTFMGCTALTKVTIGNGLEEIYPNAFDGCTSLRTVEWNPKNCTYYYISGSDFQPPFVNCPNLTHFIIGKDVESIGDNIFYMDDAKNNIDTVTSFAELSPTITAACFTDKSYNNAVLEVPAGSLEAYRNAEGWKKFFHIVAISEETVAGDVDGDGSIDVADVVAMIDFVLGKNPQPFDLEVADVTGDGIIDVNDVVALINYLLSGSW